MSNSPLAAVTLLSPNKTHPRNHAVDTVTVHCLVGQVNARRGCEIFQRAGGQSSCNYVVGCDGSIGLCVDEGDRSWCSSSQANDHRAVTIEVASDTKPPYAVTEAAMGALLDLLTDLCRRHGKKRLLWLGDKAKTLAYEPKGDELVMTVHRWFANKACPGEYLYARHGELAAAVTARLGETPPEECPAPWYAGCQAWAVEKGITDGARPTEPVTRAEVWSMLERYNKGGEKV